MYKYGVWMVCGSNKKGEKKKKSKKQREKEKEKKKDKMFAVFLLCVLRDNLCLTPAMGCAHMDDHRACRVTSVHTLQRRLKKTESNMCSAVAMCLVSHKHSS